MNQANGTPAQKVISHQLLRTMAKARYDTSPIGHFGLALADYCHFTSPIRRYPDTAIHRILSAMLQTKNKEELNRRYLTFANAAASSSSQAEVRAMQAERSAEDCYMAEFMNQHIGECYSGIISGVTQRGVLWNCRIRWRALSLWIALKEQLINSTVLSHKLTRTPAANLRSVNHSILRWLPRTLLAAELTLSRIFGEKRPGPNLCHNCKFFNL